MVRECRIELDKAISQVGIKLTPEQRKNSIAECQQARDEQTMRQHREQRARSVIGLGLHVRWNSIILARVIKVDPVDPYHATVEVIKSWKGPFSAGQTLPAQSGSVGEGILECVMGYEFSAENQELVIFTNATTDPIIVYRCWVRPAAEAQELMRALDQTVSSPALARD